MGATESKLAFRKNVFRLYEEKEILPGENDFWETFFVLPSTSEDIFTLINPRDIRLVRDKCPANFTTLLHKTLDKFFSEAAEAAVVNGPVDDTEFSKLSNCVRLLTRLLPYVFEIPGRGLERELFWQEYEAHDKQTGHRLVKCLIEMLFLGGFTLPQLEAAPNSKSPQYVIWISGICSTQDIVSTNDQLLNRLESLRLLLTILSKSMYISAKNVISFENKWVSALEKLDRRAVLSVLCSLLNTFLRYDPVGYTGILPYNYMVFADNDEGLATVCLHTLIALLTYQGQGLINSPLQSSSSSTSPQPHAALAAAFANDVDSLDSSSHFSNIFRFYISKLHRPEDFEFLLKNLVRLLRGPIDASNTYLPNASKKCIVSQELAFLLFTIVELNPKFLKFLLESDDLLTVQGALFWYILDSREDPTQAGFLRLCLFFLQVLSSSREFAVQLENPLVDTFYIVKRGRLTALSSDAKWGDLLIVIIHALTKPGSPLNETLMIILSNVSPYLSGGLSVVSTNKLVHLFNMFAHPAYLMAGEFNHRLVFYIIGSINNIIQYHGTKNPNLIYAILRNAKRTNSLRMLTFEDASAELVRVKHNKSLKEADKHSLKGVNDSNNGSRASVSGAGTPTGSAMVSGSSSAADLTDGGAVEPIDKGKGKEMLQSSGSADFSAGSPSSPTFPLWIPTDEWFTFWHDRVPLGPMIALADGLAPRLNEWCTKNDSISDQQVRSLLQKQSLVGIVPPPSPVSVRKFLWSDNVRVWECSWIWGVIYLRWGSLKWGSAAAATTNQTVALPIWAGTNVKLFTVQVI